MDRTERRQRLRYLERLQNDIASNGLPTVTYVDHLAALTRSLSSILGRGDDERRASRAARYLHGIANRSMARDPAGVGLNCRKGCAFCCESYYVSATIPQILAVADAVRRGAQDFGQELERIRRTEAPTRDLSPVQRSLVRLPCALLVDRACTAYEDRPLACRTFVSTDVNACEVSFAGGPDDIPTPESFTALRGACEQALWAALYAEGLDHGGYELNHAVLVALEEPDAERRWLAGEPVFANVRKDDSLANVAIEERESFWEVLLAVSRGEDPPVRSSRTPVPAG